MNIDIVKTDRNGTNLEIGDFVDLYDWGKDHTLIGRVQLEFDEDEGCVTCNPCMIADQYDFWTKALPNCEKVENDTRSYSEIYNYHQ